MKKKKRVIMWLKEKKLKEKISNYHILQRAFLYEQKGFLVLITTDLIRIDYILQNLYASQNSMQTVSRISHVEHV